MHATLLTSIRHAWWKGVWLSLVIGALFYAAAARTIERLSSCAADSEAAGRREPGILGTATGGERSAQSEVSSIAILAIAVNSLPTVAAAKTPGWIAAATATARNNHAVVE